MTPLTPGDRDAAVAVLAAAFLDDPVSVWVTPDADARRAGMPLFFGLMVDAFTPHGTSAVTDGLDGVALWSPSGQPLLPSEREDGPADLRAGDPERLLTVLMAMEEHKPTAPHAYLGFMGVRPDRQGQGLGGALLRPSLARLDAAGTPAYLEASTRDSARLYARHGFVETGEIVVPGGGPALWPMWREPVLS